MVILLSILHIIVCVFLVIVVLLQSGKAADLAGAFGGMGSQTAFGPRGSATILSKATSVAAGVFMVSSLFLAILATRNAGGASSVLERQKRQPVKTAPAQPAQQGAPKMPTVTVTPQGGKPQPVQPVPVQPAPQPSAPPQR